MISFRQRASALAIGAALGGSLAFGQTSGVDDSTLARLLSLPRATHQSEIRADYDAVLDRTRFWINSNEDDCRLWSPAGQQLDLEMRISAVAPAHGETGPTEVSFDLASLGSLPLADPGDALALTADGRPVVFTPGLAEAVRSGALLFLTMKTTMAPVELARVATATRVEGHVWGHRFVLVESQFELLRAYVARLAGRSSAGTAARPNPGEFI